MKATQEQRQPSEGTSGTPYCFDMGEGMPVVLLHGIFSSSRIWAPLVGRLGARSRYIAPDLPGFGRNAAIPVPPDIPGFAHFVADLLDAKRLSNCTVLGYSMGGLVAQELALLRPDLVKKLVLYSTKPSAADSDRFEPFSQTLARLEASDVMEVSGSNIEQWFAGPAHETARSLCRDAAEGVTARSAAAALAAVQGWDCRSRLSQIACPVLIVAGDRDRSVSLEVSLEHFRSLSDARFCVLPGCGHIAHLERPELFASVLEGFLETW